MAINTTASTGLSPTMKQYYDKRLIESGKAKLRYAEFAQKRPVPKNAGKTISFRRFKDYDVDGNTQLSETAVGEGVSTDMEEVTATLNAHGRYTKFSSPVVLHAIDPVISASVSNMGENGCSEIDVMIEKIVHGGTNVLYANGKASRKALAATDKLTTLEIRKAVKQLKKNKAKPFARNGKEYYICIVDPDAVFDLQDDTKWIDVSKYQEKESIFTGEIGRMFGVIFVDETAGMKYEADELPVDTTTKSSESYTAATKTLLVGALTSAQATAFAGKKILIGDKHEDEVVSATADATNGSLVLKNGYSGTATDLNGKTVYGGGAGAAGVDVMSTVVIGSNAYGTSDVTGAGGMHTIIKPKGSAGTSDPLDQFTTVGWKIDAFAVARLRDDWIVRIEHGFTV